MDLHSRYVFDAIPLGVVLQDPDGSITAANPAAEKILGLSLDQLQGRKSFDPRWRAIHADGSDFPSQDHPAMVTLRTGRPVRDVVMGVINPQLDEYTWINITAVPLPSQSGQPPYPVMATFEDITRRMQAEQRVRQLTRLYATVSQINQAIVRAKTREELFETVCKVAVTFGEFRLAWIGLYDATDGVVTPISVSAPSGLLPKPMSVINAHLDPFKASMLGTALSTGRIACQADILNDARLQSLHAVAKRFGYQSAAAVPLRSNDRVMGLLNLAAAEPDFFDSKAEIKLLEEIGLNISFALETIAAADRLEAAHHQTSEILESIRDAFYSLDREERFTYVNQRTAQLWNKHPTELVGRRLTDIFPNAAKVETFRRIRQALVTRRADHIESYSTFLNQWVETHIYPTENGVSVYFQDITARKQAQEQLKKMADLLMDGQKIAHLGSFEYDAATRQTVWSEEEFRIYGYDPEQPSPNYDTMLANSIHPEDASLLDQTFLAAIQNGAVYELEHRLVRPDGGVRWVYDRANPYFDEAGQLTRYIGVTLDITERRQALDDLQESATRYRELADSIQDGFFALDQDWRFTYINERAAHNVGRNPEDLLGKNIWTTFPQILGTQHEQLYRQVMEERQPLSFELVGALTSQWYSVKVYPSVQGISVFWIDITEQKQAEEVLRKSEQKFTTLFNQSAVPLMLTRWSDHVFINVNDAWVRMFGYTREEVYGKTSRELAINRNESLRQHARDAVGEDRPLKNLEVQVYTKSGEARIILTNVNRIEIENESYVITSVQDITDLKRAEDELRRSNAELEQFAYVASHDLQEPLRTVAGMVQLLQHRYGGQLDARADEYIHHAVDASSRMEKLINDLLDFSRVDRKAHHFELTQIDEVVKAALANLETAIAESQANVAYEPMPLVRADGGQLLQVFQNLIGNSIKYRSERPLEIHIGVKKIEDGWQFAVQDNGIGVDPQYFERVFLLFQRLHTRRKYPGTGIGLPLCKKIIERHGGKIWIESTLNQGTTLFFTLPER